jgi:hypothetical protein
MKRFAIFFAPFLFLVAGLSSCTSPIINNSKEVSASPSPTIGKENAFLHHINPKVVLDYPEEYTPLAEFTQENSEYLTWYTFEAAVGFADAESVMLIQSMFDDSNLLVSYEDELYIHKEISNSVLEQAIVNFERKNKVYAIGETIEITAGYGDTIRRALYSIQKISTIDIGGSEYKTVLIDLMVDPESHPYHIKLSVDFIVSDKGTEYREIRINSDGVFEIDIPKTEQVKKVFLKGDAFYISREVEVS